MSNPVTTLLDTVRVENLRRPAHAQWTLERVDVSDGPSHAPLHTVTLRMQCGESRLVQSCTHSIKRCAYMMACEKMLHQFNRVQYVPSPVPVPEPLLNVTQLIPSPAHPREEGTLQLLLRFICNVLDNGVRSSEADEHNARMHATNGNGLRSDLHSAIDQAINEAQGKTPAQRRALIMKKVNEALKKKQPFIGPMNKPGTNTKKPRSSAKKTANKQQHAKNGNSQWFDTDEWFSPPSVRSVEADAHNHAVHALNGNGEMTTMVPVESGRVKPEYQQALDQFAIDCRRDGLSKDANNMLLQLLDPSADMDRETFDWPTGLIDPVLTTRVVREFGITKPTSVADGETWELHVCTDQFSGGCGAVDPGWLGTTQRPGSNAASAGQDFYSADPTATAARSSFMAEPLIMHRRKTPTAANTPWFPDNFTQNTNEDIGCVPIPQTYTANPYRIGGMAFELVNTTAPLYASGSATCYEFPARKLVGNRTYIANWPVGVAVLGASDLVNVGALTAATWSHQDAPSTGVARPPKTLSDATNAKGSRTWPATKGYYGAASFEEPMDVAPPNPFVPFWYEAAQNEGIPLGTVTNQLLFPGRGVPNNSNTFVNYLVASQSTTGTSNTGGTVTNSFEWNGLLSNLRYVPTTRKGVIFSGLSSQSTFTLRVVFYLTRVPQVAQLDLYTMARKAPGFDPYFWAAYKYCVSHMPIGTTFDENPLGEWFNTVTNFLAKAGPIVGSLIPGAAGIGDIVGKVAKAGNRWNKGKDPFHKKPKKA